MSMLRLPRFLLSSLALVLAAGPLRSAPAPVAPSLASAIPVEDFFADAEISSVQVAPDGKHLAFLAKLYTGKIGIALMDLETGKTEPLVVGKDENYSWYFWKNSEYIIFGGDIGGRESHSFRSISIVKRRVVDLADAYHDVVDEQLKHAGLVDSLKFDPDHILIEGNKEVGDYSSTLYKLNIVNGERTKQYGGGDVGVSSVIVDNEGVVRARYRFNNDLCYTEVRTDDKSSFEPIASTPASLAIEAPSVAPLEFNADNRTLYVLERGPGKPTRLRAYDVPTRQFLPTPDFVVDGQFTGLIMSWDNSKLYGFVYYTDRPQRHWFDPAQAKLRAAIDAALPDTYNAIYSTSSNERVSIVFAASDRDPGTYYVLNLDNPARGRPAIMQIGKVNSRIHPSDLQPMKSISFQARDGLTIHGYLTLPANSAGRKVPLIIHPHGGPYGIRDYWEFDPEVQFYASRGYAVLQPNYRGSGGYTVDFLLAGRHEWGRKMQDDLSDAVKWAIDQGIADPNRVAIVGASYGGYAALAGVTFTPELYRCAVNYVGVSDLTIVSGWGIGNGRYHYGGERYYEHEWIGDDKAYQHDSSPVNFVQNIRVPTLHAYGDNDPRVDVDNWKRLKAQLEKYHKPYELIYEQEEGHGFRHEDTRLNFYRRVEAFLAKNL